MNELEYGGPERRANPVTREEISTLTESVRELSLQTRKVSGALAAITEVQIQQTHLEEEQQKLAAETITRREVEDRDRRRKQWILAVSGVIALVIIAAGVAIGALVFALHKEHRDFLDLRAQSVNSCNTRNLQAKNAIDFYQSLGSILISAEKQSPSPGLQAAIDAFAKAVRTVPPPVDCHKFAQVGTSS